MHDNESVDQSESNIANLGEKGEGPRPGKDPVAPRQAWQPFNPAPHGLSPRLRWTQYCLPFIEAIDRPDGEMAEAASKR